LAKNLVIVESPAKAKTIAKYLGRDYEVAASMGHIRDLPKSDLGIDVDHDFSPTYEVIKTRQKLVSDLKKKAAGKEKVFLAVDPDREGEAIAWHVKEALALPDEKTFRVTFNEITRQAVKEAFTQPGKINSHKVDAQQARRILDRIVGYKISPLLWRKVGKPGLSAGRVQSVAVRLVMEREKEIQDFVAVEFWRVTVKLASDGTGEEAVFEAAVWRKDGVKVEIGSAEEAQEAVTAIGEAALRVASVDVAERRSAAPPPFSTSLLQQQAYHKLRFTTKKTMMLAQQLYEGIETDEGSEGLITYMRTDSFRIAASALAQCKEFIKENYPECLPPKVHVFKSKAGAQEAHEAIRPTSVHRTPESLKSYLSKDQFKLYDLIWRRFVASQMKSAVYRNQTVVVEAPPYELQAKGRQLIFAGHLVVSGQPKSDTDSVLPELSQGQEVRLLECTPQQNFTQPPARYSEATLIKTLEARGIGRPSTYAPIISTIQSRRYVIKQKGSLRPTAIAEVVNENLVTFFENVFDVDFTSRMEQKLDDIEQAKADWVEVLHNFYELFDKDLTVALEKMPYLKQMTKPSDKKCPECESPMVYRYSTTGKYLACTRYPDCTKTIAVDLDGNPVEKKIVPATKNRCNKCSAPMVVRVSRRGRFLACSRFPSCRNARALGKESELEEALIRCAACGESVLLVKGGKEPQFACGSCGAAYNIEDAPLTEAS